MQKNFKIEWHCRRGMLELDNIIMPFFRQHFNLLSIQQQQDFIQLLNCSDLQLFEYFFKHKIPEKDNLTAIITTIRQKLELNYDNHKSNSN